MPNPMTTMKLPVWPRFQKDGGFEYLDADDKLVPPSAIAAALNDGEAMRGTMTAQLLVVRRIVENCTLSEQRQEALRLLNAALGYLATKEQGVAESSLAKAIRETERDHPLPRCKHGSALMDHAGERLEPPCGCRASSIPAPQSTEGRGRTPAHVETERQFQEQVTEVGRLLDVVSEMRKALEPFAKLGDRIEAATQPKLADSALYAGIGLTVGNFRAARVALAQTNDEGETIQSFASGAATGHINPSEEK